LTRTKIGGFGPTNYLATTLTAARRLLTTLLRKKIMSQATNPHSLNLLVTVEAMIEARTPEDFEKIKSRNSPELVSEAWAYIQEINQLKSKAFGLPEKPKPKSKPTAYLPSLWELSEEIKGLEDAIAEIRDSEDFSLTEKEEAINRLFLDYLESGNDFDTKACQVAHYIKSLEALTEARRNEYRRLRELAEQSDKQAEKLRDYLVAQMEKVGKKKISGTTANLSLRKKPARVILIADPEDLPGQFRKVEVTARLSALKDYLKTHPDCEFATMSTLEEFSLTIK
jgi:vacuolar-type H+-ATPase subunit I/STV1